MKYSIFFFALWITTAIVIFGGIVNFLYASPYCITKYPILPFDAYPSYYRGGTYSMEGIIGLIEYSDECGSIKPWIERPQELDSLCIYSIILYAWKKDLLLMQVALDNGSSRWLLASPASSPKYRCKLQEVTAPSNDELKSYHKITLHSNAANNQLLSAYVELILSIIHVIFFFTIPVLNLICIILAIKLCNKWDVLNISSYKKIICAVFYILTIIMPTAVWIVIRTITNAPLIIL